MGKIIMISAVTALAMGCGPDIDDDGDDPPGVLEYEIPTARFYRLDRRVDVVGVDPTNDRSGCGFLTDRAYEDLTRAVGELDPNAEYARSDCSYVPDGILYIEGFVHSPFACSWWCCHDDLLSMGVAYLGVISNIYGQEPTIDGEPYVALEPDMPCPD